MNSMKRQKDMTLKDDPLRSVGVQYTTGKDWRNSYRKNEKAKAKQGFPVAQTVKNLPECRRPGFNPWVGKIPWRRKWQATPVFLPGEFCERGVWWATVHGVAKSRKQLSS